MELMRVGLLALSIAISSCATTQTTMPERLAGGDGVGHVLVSQEPGVTFTVLTFFSATCPCQRAHDTRIIELHRRFAPLGVRFLSVDSEAGASRARAAAEAAARGYPFPILVDASGHLAAALDADVATHSVVIDRDGQVRYRGGVDSDQNVLTAKVEPYLAEALEALVNGRDPPHPEQKTRGCLLQREWRSQPPPEAAEGSCCTKSKRAPAAASGGHRSP